MKRTLLVLLLSPIIIFSHLTVSHSQYTITQLTNNAYDDKSPQINDNGHVVWSGWERRDAEIFLYDGTSTTNLSNNTHIASQPKINDDGYVVWDYLGHQFQLA